MVCLKIILSLFILRSTFQSSTFGYYWEKTEHDFNIVFFIIIYIHKVHKNEYIY